MFRPRVIPCLLLRGKGLVKTVKFKNGPYLGDPHHAAYLFSVLQADELIFLDIDATNGKRCVDADLISKLSDESYMPLSVGGGIRSVDEMRRCFSAGAEKMIINSYFVENPDFVSEAADVFGSQSVIVSIDCKLGKSGRYEAYTHSGTRPTGTDPVSLAITAEAKGAGEIFVNSIDRDGTQKGYDVELIRSVSDAVRIPVIACGGAGRLEDLADAYSNGHAAALAAGSLFVFHGPLNAVLINYPDQLELERLFATNSSSM